MSMHHPDDPKTEGPTDWGVSLTKQSEEPATNINNIIKRYKRTGQLTHISQALGEYRDTSGIPDLAEAMNIVASANSTFAELPAEIRKLCKHDAANFLPFIDDPANFDQCVELGLFPAPENTAKSVPTPPEPAEESPVQGGE